MIRVAMWLVVPAFVVVSAVPVSGQYASMSTSYFSDRSGHGPEISRSDLEVFFRVLELSEDERAVVSDVYDAYVSEWRVGFRAARNEAADLIERAEILQDASMLARVSPIRDAWNEEAKRIEEAFLENLSVLLTNEQEARWPLLERELRRKKSLQRGRLAGESVDVVRLVGQLVAEDRIGEEVASLLEQYSQELDAALVRRDRFLDDHRPGYSEVVGSDLERAEELYWRALRMRIAVADVNAAFVRRIASTLGGEDERRLLDAFRESSYGIYFKPTRNQRIIEAAAELEGLDAAQRAEVEALVDEYLDLVRTFHDREMVLRDQIEREDLPEFLVDARREAAGEPPESSQRYDWRGDDHPLSELRRERLALDRRYRERVFELLTEAQVDALPDPAAGQIRFFRYGLGWPSL